MRSAELDIMAVERWGYTRAEALEYVTWRAVLEARRITGRPHSAADPAEIRHHLRYLRELRAICLDNLDDLDDATAA